MSVNQGALISEISGAVREARRTARAAAGPSGAQYRAKPSRAGRADRRPPATRVYLYRHLATAATRAAIGRRRAAARHRRAILRGAPVATRARPTSTRRLCGR